MPDKCIFCGASLSKYKNKQFCNRSCKAKYFGEKFKNVSDKKRITIAVNPGVLDILNVIEGSKSEAFHLGVKKLWIETQRKIYLRDKSPHLVFFILGFLFTVIHPFFTLFALKYLFLFLGVFLLVYGFIVSFFSYFVIESLKKRGR